MILYSPALAEVTPATMSKVNFRGYEYWCNLLPSGAVHRADVIQVSNPVTQNGKNERNGP